MARRPPMIKSSKKKTKMRTTKTENYLINRKYLGDEPAPFSKFQDGGYARALTWYNYQCTTDDARQYLIEYLIDTERQEQADTILRVSDIWIPLTACWGARMLSRGVEVPDTTLEFVERKIDETLERVKKPEVSFYSDVSETDEEVKPEPSIKRSIQERMKEKTYDLIGDIEHQIDTNPDFNMYEYLKSNEIPVSYTNSIIDYYSPFLIEWVDTMEFNDEQLIEGYCYLDSDEIEGKVLFYNQLLEDAERYGNNTKKTRAARTPKAVPVEKKLKYFQYQKEDNGFKLASVNPEKVLGASELWTFNTKYKILTVLRAADSKGLDVKGTTILNYDPEKSMSKRTGRKPEPILDRILKGNKAALKLTMSELDKDVATAHRINENTILLRAL